MRALFIVPFPHEQSLPPMRDIQYEENGELHGGWWVVGHVPQTNTVMVVIDTTDAMIESMNANPEYLFVEDIPDEIQTK